MDRYTKGILTIIALSLLWLCIQAGGLISNAFAASGTVKIEIVDVNVGKFKTLPVYVTGELKCSP